MSTLLEVYDNMQKEAEQNAVVNERVTLIEKYAEIARTELEKEFKKDFTNDDIAELTTKMIEHDMALEEQQEKVAELEEAGRVMARAFVEEVKKGKQ